MRIFRVNRGLLSVIAGIVLLGFVGTAVISAVPAFRGSQDDGPVTPALSVLAASYLRALENDDAERLVTLAERGGRPEEALLEDARAEVAAFRDSARAGEATVELVASDEAQDRREIVVRFADGRVRTLEVVGDARFAGYPVSAASV